MDTQQRQKEIEKASWVGIAGNGILGVLKIGIGIISGSLAVLGDGIDSSTDIITSVITLATAKIISKPPDREHPYGHARAETIATKALSFIIFFAGAQLVITTISSFFRDQIREKPSSLAIYITIASIIGKIFLSYYKFKIGKKTESFMLIADARNMRNDVIISASVLLGLIFIYLLNKPVIDAIIAFLVGLWIMKSALDIFMKVQIELMDGIDDRLIYNKIFKAVELVTGASNPHRTRVRKLGNLIIIDLDIEVDGTLSVKEGHQIGENVEDAIKTALYRVYDVIVHIEPEGNIEKNEKFGLSKENI